MNINDNDNRPFPPIQLLIPECLTVDQDDSPLTWLHGFCLVTYSPLGVGLKLNGVIRIGERFAENLDMIRDLTEALDPEAVLAGYDLTAAISSIGRLPIEANDPQPALDLLARIKAMLEMHDPIDLSIDDSSQTQVTVQLLRNQFNDEEGKIAAADDELFEMGLLGLHDSSNPSHVAADLTEAAGAYLLAIGQLYIPDELGPDFRAAVERWERDVQPQLPPRQADGENGGEVPTKK